MRHNAATPVERERAEVKHEKITVRNKCQWRTLKPQGNTGPMRPAKGNSPGEAELSNGPTECGETAAGAAEPSPRGWNAPLGELTTSTAFPRKVIRRRTRSRTAGRWDGGTAGRRDGGTAGQRNDRAAGRRDGGTVGWRDGGMAIQRDGGMERMAAVEWRRRQRIEKHGGRWAVDQS